MSYAPDDYALVIGIDHYPKWADGRRSLKGAVNDAEDFHKWLISPTGGGLPPRNARLVLSTQDPVAPLQNIIDEEFRAIRTLSKDRTRRRFYFYFSGHGHSPAMSEAQALCLANWSLEDQGAALQLDSYRKASAGCLNFEESLFFVDCCRVREVTPLGKASDLECGAPRLDGRHYIVFYATEHYESGYEDDAEDARGYFTKALVRILRAGTIEAQELGRRLGVEVEELAKPRRQVARHLSYAGREIFLGPPTLPAQPVAPAPEPTGPAKTAELDVSLVTNLETESGPGEHAPAPPPGEITVSQGDRIIESGRGGLRAVLPLGRYAIRVRHGEAAVTHEIELNGDRSFPLELPRRYSAAPLSSTVEKHEFITDPMVDASKQRPFDDAQAIFVALRRRDAAFHGRIPGSLVIRNFGTQELNVADPLTVMPAQPGTYELQYSDPDGTTHALSVPVARGWDTQIFLVEHRGRLAIERASVLMQAAGHGFNPADALIDAYEIALADLVSGGPGPDRRTLEDLLHGKFRNPLFGLVGAHFLVRELRAAERFSPERHDLLRIVIKNLAKLFGVGNPDVLALRFLWAQLAGEPAALSFTHEASGAPPPLLQAGLQALIGATAHYPALFTQLDDVAMGLRPNSAWACWRRQEKDVEVFRSAGHGGRMRDHIRMSPRPRLGALARIYVDAGYSVSRIVLGTDHQLEAREHRTSRRLAFDEVLRLATMPDWVVAVMRDEIEQGERTRQSLDYGKLVSRLRLPRGLLEQAERIVRAEMATAATPTETATRVMVRGA